jgi:hypothetical protein
MPAEDRTGRDRHAIAPARQSGPLRSTPRRALMWCAAACLCILAAASLPGRAHAHGGLSLEKDYCKLRVGPYFMHFTGYQPERDATKEFCEDIPATGPTIIVLDFVDEALKELPVGVRIARDGGETDIDRLTIYRLPPKQYPNGSLSLDFQFDEPGNYVGLVSADVGDRQLVARFPFSVGAPLYFRYPYMMVLLAVGLGGAYGIWRWRRAAVAHP